MKKILNALILIAVLGCFSAVQADELEEEYQARLSAFDHYSSSDQKLDSVAAIIRQDRANYHKFKVRDEEDQGDGFFSSAGNREALEGMLEKTRFTKAERNLILTGTPLINVRIFTSDETGKKYLVVIVFDSDG